MWCTGRDHILKVQLPAAYPEAAPLVTAQLPEQVKLPPWQPGLSGLQDLVRHHEVAIASLQDLWACLEDLDRCGTQFYACSELSRRKPTYIIIFLLSCNHCEISIWQHECRVCSSPDCSYVGKVPNKL